MCTDSKGRLVADLTDQEGEILAELGVTGAAAAAYATEWQRRCLPLFDRTDDNNGYLIGLRRIAAWLKWLALDPAVTGLDPTTMARLTNGADAMVTSATRRFHGTAGQVPDDIDDLIGRWHNLPAGHPDADKTLHEYLGMTWEEYAAWVEDHPVTATAGAGDVTHDCTYQHTFLRVEKVLDVALGTREEDGTGEGVAADVHLLAAQRDTARAALSELVAALTDVDLPGSAKPAHRTAVLATEAFGRSATTCQDAS